MALPGVRLSNADFSATPVVRRGGAGGVSVSVDARIPVRDMSREIMEAGFSLEHGIRKLTDAVDRVHEHRVSRDTFNAVTAAKMAYQNSDLQNADEDARKVSALSYYGLKGESAVGASSNWFKSAEEDMQRRMKDMDPDVRERFLETMAPFMAGMRENLFQYETREVNSGRKAAITANVTKLSDDLASSITTQASARAEQDAQEVSERETMLAGVEKADESARAVVAEDVKARAAASAESRKAFVRGLVDQTYAQIDMGATAIDAGVAVDPVYGQLYSPLEAAAIKQGAAKKAYSGVVAGLSASGRFDEAEAFVDALEEGKGPDGETGRTRGLTAELYGFDDDDIRDLRGRILTGRKQFEEAAAKRVKAGCDQFDRAMDDNKDPTTWVGQLRGMASNPQVLASDRARAEEYGRQADFLEKCFKHGATFDRLPTKERLTDDIEYDIEQLKMLQNPNVYGGALDEDVRAKAISAAQNRISIGLRVGVASRLIDAGKFETLHGRFKTTLTDFQNRAMAKFYDAFGMDVTRLNLKKDGALSESDTRAIEDANAWYSLRGTYDEDGGVGLRGRDFVKAAHAFRVGLESLGELENREEVADNMLREMKIRWAQERNFDTRIGIMTKSIQEARIDARQ